MTKAYTLNPKPTSKPDDADGRLQKLLTLRPTPRYFERLTTCFSTTRVLPEETPFRLRMSDVMTNVSATVSIVA